MKILLFGRGGQVGWELQRSLSLLGDLVALDFDARTNPQQLCGDFTDLAGLAQTVQRVQPDVIVNAAAHTAVDKAETETAQAQAINAHVKQRLNAFSRFASGAETESGATGTVPPQAGARKN